MKQIFSTLILIIISFSVVVAQQVPEGIVKAFEKGNTKQLAVYLNDNVEIKLIEKEYVTSKNQAIRILQDFFKQYPPVSFDVTYKDVKKNTNYGVGLLKTKKAEFKVDLYFLDGREEKIIYYLIFEKTEEWENGP